MSSQIGYALHASSGRIIHISEAERGLKCHCRCIECGAELEAVKGDIRDHHFRHAEDKACGGGQETAIHILAKQIIADNTEIIIPGRRLLYSNATIERWLDRKRPDVTCWVNDRPVYFEIMVNNQVKKEKKQFYANGKHNCIEIDLSDKEIWRLSPEQLKELVLEKTYNKHIINWEEATTKAHNRISLSDLFWIIIFFISMLLFINWAFARRKN
jgi:hypothetical protein